MECCKCGKVISIHKEYFMLSKRNTNNYYDFDFYCCDKCYQEWDRTFRKHNKKNEFFPDLWARIFFTIFLKDSYFMKSIDNPSKRIVKRRIIPKRKRLRFP